MITSLQLQNFRSYSESSFEFDPGVNIIVGPNASGKTNLLEATLMICRGSSFRNKDIDLIRSGSDWARLNSRLVGDQTRTIKIKNDSESVASKSFEINEKVFKRLPARLQLPVVLFEPQHLLLISGSPESRRNFFDDLAERLHPSFAATRRHYRRVLSQRNSLLKAGGPSLNTQLFVWNMRLTELGSQIAKVRASLIKQINQDVTDVYSQIADKKQLVDISYMSKFSVDDYASQLMKKLETNLALEISRGYTLYGPHRDDVLFSLNDQLVDLAASRGEIRTMLLALKFIELKLVSSSMGAKPIILLDDVFSELDGRRRQALTDFVKDYQTFITTTDADVVIQYFTDKAKILLTSN